MMGCCMYICVRFRFRWEEESTTREEINERVQHNTSTTFDLFNGALGRVGDGPAE